MLRSMFTAISSLNIHQAYMDVIADNLANANTVGYKASRVIFQDQFAQLMSAGAPPSATAGGINPTQIGLGAQIGFISPVFTQGALQNSGRNLDLAMQGDGFFVYSNGAGQYYSRDGSVGIDANGYLVNSSTGLRIQGWNTATPGGTIDSTAPINSIAVPTDATLAKVSTSATIGGNINSNPATGDPAPTMTVGVYDALGELHSAKLTFTRDSADLTGRTWTVAATVPPAVVPQAAGSVVFDANGQIVTGSGTPGTINIPGSPGTGSFSVALDYSELTMLAAPDSIAMSSQDGLPAGSLTDIYVAPKNGEVYMLFSNGLKQLVGQLSVAKFTNPTGLVRSGQNMFQNGLNSGDAQIGTAETGGRGLIVAGYREGSNVDMAQEFTSMILAQRGFQASSRVITTSDEMLMELVNLKR